MQPVQGSQTSELAAAQRKVELAKETAARIVNELDLRVAELTYVLSIVNLALDEADANNRVAFTYSIIAKLTRLIVDARRIANGFHDEEDT